MQFSFTSEANICVNIYIYIYREREREIQIYIEEVVEWTYTCGQKTEILLSIHSYMLHTKINFR